MEKKGDLWEVELWTQNEVADYFRVTPNTIKNWREQGLLSYWQAPGSSRVLYLRDGIKDFRIKNTQPKKGGGQPQVKQGMIKGKPVKSSTLDDDWRI